MSLSNSNRPRFILTWIWFFYFVIDLYNYIEFSSFVRHRQFHQEKVYFTMYYNTMCLYFSCKDNNYEIYSLYVSYRAIKRIHFAYFSSFLAQFLYMFLYFYPNIIQLINRLKFYYYFFVLYFHRFPSDNTWINVH